MYAIRSYYDSPAFIPNSVKVDIEDDLSDLTSDAVHAFPTEQQFNELCQRLGITHDHTVVIYDDQGIYSSPRIWWIFKSFGVEKVFILDGGLPKWLQEHKPVTADRIVITSYSIHYTKLYDSRSPMWRIDWNVLRHRASAGTCGQVSGSRAPNSGSGFRSRWHWSGSSPCW